MKRKPNDLSAAAAAIRTTPLPEARHAAANFADLVHDELALLSDRIDRLETLAGMMNGAENVEQLEGHRDGHS